MEQSLLDVKLAGEAALLLTFTSPAERPIHRGRERRRLSLLSFALRFWFRRCYWRSGWRALALLCTCAHRPQFNRFSFECAVSILPIRTAGFFVLGNVFHGRSFSTLGDRGLVCDLEDAGFLFSSDRECLRVLVHCRDHSVKRDRPCALLRWRSGWRCSRFWRSRRRTRRLRRRLRVEQRGKSQTRDAKDYGEMKFGSHNLLGSR
jgi:hypothetical protein